MNIELLNAAGFDYEKGLARFLGDESLYDRVLAMFLDDTTLDDAEKAFAERDYETLFACVHTLKGVCGNVEMTDVFAIARSLSDLLRDGCADEEAAASQLKELRIAYDRARDGIRAAQSS